MLVASRQVNESMMLGDGLLVTVLKIRSKEAAIRAVTLRAPSSDAPDTCDFTFSEDDRRELAPGVFCTLVQVRGDKVRLGFEIPVGLSVYRKEVYDAIRLARGDGGDPDTGSAGAPVPSKPKPGRDSGSAKQLPPDEEQ